MLQVSADRCGILKSMTEAHHCYRKDRSSITAKWVQMPTANCNYQNAQIKLTTSVLNPPISLQVASNPLHYPLRPLAALLWILSFLLTFWGMFCPATFTWWLTRDWLLRMTKGGASKWQKSDKKVFARRERLLETGKIPNHDALRDHAELQAAERNAHLRSAGAALQLHWSPSVGHRVRRGAEPQGPAGLLP